MPRTNTPPCKGANYHVFALGADACSMCGWRRHGPPKPHTSNNIRYVDLGEWTLKHPRPGQPATVRARMTVDLDKMNPLVGKARSAATRMTTVCGGGITITVEPFDP